MRRINRLLLLALVTALLTMAVAEEVGDVVDVENIAEATEAPTEEPTVEPTEEPTVEPTEEPTVEPTEEPTVKPTEEPTVEPTEEPAVEPTEEPTVEPTEEPAVEPTEEPTLEPTEEPAVEPTEEPTLEPTEEPTLEPMEEPTLEPMEEPAVEPTEEPAVEPTEEPTAGPTLIPEESPSPTPEAPSGDEQPEGFPEGEQPEDFPGGGGFPGGGFSGGGFRSGGSRSGSDQGGDVAADAGFSVTPGQALISTHASGERDMRLYGTVELSTTDEPMSRLTLGDSTLDIATEEGGMFTAAIDAGTLALSPLAACEGWTLNGYALRILSASGIDVIRLSLGGDTFDMPTRPELTGREYARLRAEGYVSHDFTFMLRADGLRISVAGTTYRLSEAGELIEAGEP